MFILPGSIFIGAASAGWCVVVRFCGLIALLMEKQALVFATPHLIDSTIAWCTLCFLLTIYYWMES
jgi:hypothetical protein